MIPSMPSRLSGDGGLNPTKAKIAPIASPNAPDCSADNNSDLFNNSFILRISNFGRTEYGNNTVITFGSISNTNCSPMID